MSVATLETEPISPSYRPQIRAAFTVEARRFRVTPENLFVCGLPGSAKTFLFEALGQRAVEAGLHSSWSTLENLGVPLHRHRADDTVAKAIAPRILSADLIVVDDIGLLPVPAMPHKGWTG